MRDFLYDASTEIVGCIIGLTVAAVATLALVVSGALASALDRVAALRRR